MTDNPFASKMTEAQRKEAIRRYERGGSLNRIAHEYGMSSASLTKKKSSAQAAPAALTAQSKGYTSFFDEVATILEDARRASARSVNAIMTATYWEIGRRIVEHEQGGRARAEYGEELLERLSADLTARFGRGYSERNVWQMKAFYLAWPILQTMSAESSLARISSRFPLPWSAYVRLLAVKNDHARRWRR